MTTGTYGRYGISTVITNLVIQLVKLGNNVTVAAFHFSKFPPDGIRWKRLTRPLNLINLHKKFDVIHNHQPSTNFILALSQIPFIYEHHGHGWSPNTNRLSLGYISRELSLRLVQRFKPKIIAVSQTAANELLCRIKDLDVEIVPLGVDNERFNLLKDERYRRGKPQLLFAGHLHHYKRVDELISAMKEIILLYPDAHLQIVGSGSQLRSLMNQVDHLRLNNHIGFSGWVSEYELPFYFSSCDIYVTASRYETFGLPLIEAMACGKLVVASSIPPHVELLTKSKAGTTYSKGDIEDLCNKIVKTYEEKDKLRSNALHFAKEHDWSVVADRVLRIYDKII